MVLLLKMLILKKLIEAYIVYGLTPRGHHQPGEHRFRDQHTQASILFFVCPPVVPLYRIYEPNLV